MYPGTIAPTTPATAFGMIKLLVYGAPAFRGFLL
jgi:hypothetical protein